MNVGYIVEHLKVQCEVLKFTNLKNVNCTGLLQHCLCLVKTQNRKYLRKL
jgi:hypothetical protein